MMNVIYVVHWNNSQTPNYQRVDDVETGPRVGLHIGIHSAKLLLMSLDLLMPRACVHTVNDLILRGSGSNTGTSHMG